MALSPAIALADGAFPDSQSLFVPSGAPHQIFLGTNFGILLSDDDGVTWRWICEGAIAPFPFIYQVGQRSDVFYAVNVDGLHVSHDHCTWALINATGTSTKATVSDLFPDPSSTTRVLAIGRGTLTSTAAPRQPDQIFESADAGDRFEPILTSTDGTSFESLEIAKSDALRVYLTGSRGHPATRFVLRSDDGGKHVMRFDQTAVLGGRLPLIAAVDPMNADRIFFRVYRNSPDEGDMLAISDDGGAHLRIAYKLSTLMSAFVELPDGTLLVGTRTGGFISKDQGASFAPWSGSPMIRALAYRGGLIYVAADDFGDGYAVGVSSNLGQSWTKLLTWAQISGPLPGCDHVRVSCETPLEQCGTTSWSMLMDMFGILPDAGNADAAAACTPAPPGSKTCHCTSTERGRSTSPVMGFALLVALWRARSPRIAKASFRARVRACSAARSPSPPRCRSR
jgi:hypothetical protein